MIKDNTLGDLIRRDISVACDVYIGSMATESMMQDLKRDIVGVLDTHIPDMFDLDNVLVSEVKSDSGRCCTWNVAVVSKW